MRSLTGRRLQGKVLKAGKPLTRVLSDLIVSLSRLDMEIAPEEAGVIEDAIAELVATAAARDVSDDANLWMHKENSRT